MKYFSGSRSTTSLELRFRLLVMISSGREMAVSIARLFLFFFFFVVFCALSGKGERVNSLMELNVAADDVVAWSDDLPGVAVS